MRWNWPLVLSLAYLAICLLLDLFPTHGPPHFRYTGADPDFSVWNLGWPLAMFIYDPRIGFQMSPLAPLLIGFQLFVYFVIVGLTLVVKMLRRDAARSGKLIRS